jgi:D-psicose/D-tagatose/L-ribulose 3-epimerase
MRPEPLRTTLARLQRFGYSSVELAGEPQQFPVPETLALLEEYGIRCWGTVTIQTGHRDLTAPDAQQRRDTVMYMQSVVDMCARLGGEIVTVVPGRVGKTIAEASPQDEWEWVVAGLREVAAYAEQRKIRIALEPLNRFETHFLNRADQALALADAAGHGCGIAFDTFHMSMEERDIYAAMRACASRIFDFHTGDTNRWAAGDGMLDWPKLMSVLRESGYDGGVTFESMPPIDRTPLGDFGAAQLDTRLEEVSAEQMQFIKDHGSGLLSDEHYTSLLERNADTLRPLL